VYLTLLFCFLPFPILLSPTLSYSIPYSIFLTTSPTPISSLPPHSISLTPFTFTPPTHSHLTPCTYSPNSLTPHSLHTPLSPLTPHSLPSHPTPSTPQELTLADDDVNLGHLGLALVSYCKIAALYVKHQDESLSASGVSVCLDTTPMGAANEIFLGEIKRIRCRLIFIGAGVRDWD
jgi:hypothetical protein